MSALAPSASAQPVESVGSISLDTVVRIELDSPLSEGLEAIAKQTGLRIVLDPEVNGLLPWGSGTQLTANLHDLTLRDAIRTIARNMGLEASIDRNAVVLKPHPAIRRLGRRATVEELGAIAAMSNILLGESRPTTLGEFAESADAAISAADTPYGIDFVPGDTLDVQTPLAIPANATLLEALDSVARDTPATWFPWGKAVMLTPRSQAVRQQLSRTLTAQYTNADVSQLLQDFSRTSGVAFTIEPGALQSVPAEFRTLNLTLENATVLQGLESVGGVTGLGYRITNDGVDIRHETTAGSSGMMLGVTTLDGGVQVLLPADQLPADVREYLKSKASLEIDNIRRKIAGEGFAPVPASQP